MLVLVRNLGQSLRVGNDLTVKILSVSGNRVRLGFEGPKSTTVWRSEIPQKETRNVPASDDRAEGQDQ